MPLRFQTAQQHLKSLFSLLLQISVGTDGFKKDVFPFRLLLYCIYESVESQDICHLALSCDSFSCRAVLGENLWQRGRSRWNLVRIKLLQFEAFYPVSVRITLRDSLPRRKNKDEERVSCSCRSRRWPIIRLSSTKTNENISQSMQVRRNELMKSSLEFSFPITDPMHDPQKLIILFCKHICGWVHAQLFIFTYTEEP